MADRWDWTAAANICHREARRVLGHAADAEDAAQEALIRAWRFHARCRDSHNEPWLRAIARNEAHRQRERARDVATPMFDHQDPADTMTIEEVVERLDVRAALATLTPADRAALAARYVFDLTQPAAAAAIGVPEGTMKVRLHRARARLRENLIHQE
jgi:RNA polymerase sigma-70 factor (ECF subfamily)